MYTLYNAVLTITIFFQRIYTMGLKISLSDTAKAVIVCILENVFFRLFLDGVRVMAFIGYGKRKSQWGAAYGALATAGQDCSFFRRRFFAVRRPGKITAFTRRAVVV